ncbi:MULTISPECIES: carbohydrate kinase [unclassified Herbaspirillum]|uniref:carbohydrate kinase family protein n=1 Tax=unclassified Herbaspirillum TaxID=2624150 RepID=UPI001154A378|nr:MULTISPECIES: carbohydrate kinase [unclassified Herbaspirillum]MBB5392585.1 fructokinase [Herbaspirillum sp. SJZ102]TQK06222.1 fructokinase [Herbaspirillum sp. SJZ130]TQK12300.1 fructokinase [Herbaspirillum sp. SJZ106]TWC68426.1 fructokinase [Herbaspirillum sp. SJZ099]
MTQPAQFVVFGEALTDFIRQSDGQWRAMPGGACWNVARAAARLGVPTGYAGSVSTDVFGQELHALTREAGLDMRFTQQYAKAPLLAMVTSTTPPDYFFIGDDSADLHFNPERLPSGWMDQVRVLHFGCISLAREPLASRLLQVAKAGAMRGKKIAFDPNWRKLMDSPSYRILLRELLALSDYVKVSDEDLERLFPGDGNALATLQDMAPKAEILLTLGAQGMRWIKGEQVVQQPAYKVEVVDTVGCGDASMGGWIASQLRQPDAPAQVHLQCAAAGAAIAASKPGAYAATWDEVQAMIERG